MIETTLDTKSSSSSHLDSCIHKKKRTKQLDPSGSLRQGKATLRLVKKFSVITEVELPSHSSCHTPVSILPIASTPEY